MTPTLYYRRNFTAFMGDYIGFALAFTMISTTTVIPSLVGQLTDSKLAVGLITSVSHGAWLLPQLVFANLITNKRRKKPYIIAAGVLGRPLYLMYAIALGLGLYLNPSLALLLLFVVQIVFYGWDALAAVAWFDVMGKAIPDSRRGRLFGGGQLIGGLLSVGAGVLIAYLLSDNGLAFPYNYSVILALAGFVLLFSLISIGFVVEPDEPVAERRTAWRDYLPALLHTLHQDPALTRLIVVRLLAGFDTLAMGFYILFATQELGLPAATVGLFTAAQTVGRILTSVGFGAIAERTGSHRVVQLATGIGVTAPLAGLTLMLTGGSANSTATAVCFWVFMTIGISMSAGMLGYFNYILELAPAGQRPTYIGLLNTATGILVVLPTIGGWVLRSTSYGVLFALTAVVLIVAHLLSFTLPSARQTTPHLQAEPVV